MSLGKYYFSALNKQKKLITNIPSNIDKAQRMSPCSMFICSVVCSAILGLSLTSVIFFNNSWWVEEKSLFLLLLHHSPI